MKNNGAIKWMTQQHESKSIEYVIHKLNDIANFSFKFGKSWNFLCFLFLGASEEKPEAKWQDHSPPKIGFPIWKGQCFTQSLDTNFLFR